MQKGASEELKQIDIKEKLLNKKLEKSEELTKEEKAKLDRLVTGFFKEVKELNGQIGNNPEFQPADGKESRLFNFLRQEGLNTPFQVNEERALKFLSIDAKMQKEEIHANILEAHQLLTNISNQIVALKHEIASFDAVAKYCQKYPKEIDQERLKNLLETKQALISIYEKEKPLVKEAREKLRQFSL